MKLFTLCATSLLAATTLGACGSDAKTTPDANKPIDAAIDAPPITIDSPPAAACPVPATIPAMITISGTGRQLRGTSLVNSADVLVEAFRGAATTPEATTMTAADGKYSITFTTNGVGVDGTIRGKKATFLDSYLYPGKLIYADVASAPVLMLTQSDIDLVAQLSGAAPLASGTNFVGVAVTDCDGKSLAGATITTTPTVKIRYNNANGFPSSSATATAADGVAFLFEVPAGNLAITATVAGLAYPARTVKVVANSTAATIVSP